MINKYNAGDLVVCDWGSNKGKLYIITKVLTDKNIYACKEYHMMDSKYYAYNDMTLTPCTMEHLSALPVLHLSALKTDLRNMKFYNSAGMVMNAVNKVYA